jgi:predicted kinase
MKPLLIVISGPPCAGKTTLAKRLGERFALPVLGKDMLKERLFDTLGWQDREWSRVLGRASIALLFQFVETQLTARRSCIVESNFHADVDGPRFLALRERHACVIMNVNCFADGNVLLARFKQRAASTERHPGHRDHLNDAELRPILSAGRMAPLSIGGPVLEVDTTNFDTVDLTAVYEEITRLHQ